MLTEILADQTPDFVVLCSSVNAVVGGVGQIDYCAANAFMDAFAHAQTGRTGTTTLSVNWDTWSEVGMAVETDVPRHLQEQRALELKQGITTPEGQEVFARLLATALPQVLVSTRDFAEMQSSRQGLGQEASETPSAEGENRRARHPRPELTTAYVAPRDEMEQTISEIWQQELGIDRVGMHDNFFELGGDSLLAVQVMARIRETTNATLQMAGFLRRSDHRIAEHAPVEGEAPCVRARDGRGAPSGPPDARISRSAPAA